MSDKVEIDKKLLLEIAGFLLASSNYYDMDKLPVKFIDVAYHFGYELDTICGNEITNSLPGREYNLFESLYKRYLESESVKEHDEYIKNIIDNLDA